MINCFLVNWEIVNYFWWANLSLVHGLGGQNDIWVVNLNMVIKNPQNVHKIYFQIILMTFICDVKFTSLCVSLIVLIFLWTSSLVQLLTFWHLTSFRQFDILYTFCHIFEIPIHDLFRLQSMRSRYSFKNWISLVAGNRTLWRIYSNICFLVWFSLVH